MTQNEENCLFMDPVCKLQKALPETICDAYWLLKSALKITDLGIWQWDFRTKKVKFSKELFEIVGINPDEFDGTIEFIANKIIHPDYYKEFLDRIENDLRFKHVGISEYRIQNESIQACWVRVHGQLIFDEDGNPIEMIGTVLNVTKDYVNRKQLMDQLDFFETLIESSPNPIFYKDHLGIYRYCNQAFLDYLGLERDHVIIKSVYDIAPRDLAEIYEKADQKLIVEKGVQVYESKVQYSDGTLHDVIFSKAVHIDDQHCVKGVVGLIHDITEKKTMEKQLKMLHQVKDVFLSINHQIMSFESEEDMLNELLKKLQLIFEPCCQSTVLQLGIDNNFRILTSCGYEEESVRNFVLPIEESFIWTSCGDLEAVCIIDSIQEHMKSKGLTKLAKSEKDILIQSSLIVPIVINGAFRWIFSFDSIENKGFSQIHKKVAEFIREEVPLLLRIFDLYKRNLYLSRYDSLTGLMSRSYFENIFSDRLMVSLRNKIKLCVIMFDLDGLKRINDRYGHGAGDVYIKSFSQLLTMQFRESDAFSRIGGDEFVGLLFSESKTSLEQKIIEMRHDFENEKIRFENYIFAGSFSFGIVESPEDAIEPSELLRQADKNMYKDKARFRAL